MIDISQELLDKIDNPMQLPSNDGEPTLILIITGRDYANEVESGTISCQLEDYAFSVNLKMIVGDNDLYSGDIFVPGTQLTISIKFGDSEAIKLFKGTIDEVDWTVDDGHFNISATGDISHFLKETTMGEIKELKGHSHEVAREIFAQAGVEPYYVTEGDYEWTYTYKPEDTCLSALEQMYPIFPKKGETPGFGILEKPGDGIIFGYWVDRVDPEIGVPVGVYIFDIGKEVFTQSMKINIDKCYSKVIATGKAADGVDLEPVTVEVNNIQSFSIPDNKIYHAKFNGYTHQELLQDWAETIAMELEEQGITWEFTGPIRPQVTVGDIAVIPYGEEGVRGVITSITHHVGLDGFYTDFSVDSGGVESQLSGWTSNAKSNGYNRRQNLVELVREIAEETAERALDLHDPVSVQNMWDEEQEEEKELIPERNEFLVEFDGRNWQDLVPVDHEDDDEEEEEEES